MMNVVLWVKLNQVQRLVPAVTELFQAEMKALGHMVTNALNLTRVELFQAIKIKKLQTSKMVKVEPLDAKFVNQL
jgi:hypothetical protein